MVFKIDLGDVERLRMYFSLDTISYKNIIRKDLILTESLSQTWNKVNK